MTQSNQALINVLNSENYFELLTFIDALNDKYKENWEKAIDLELQSLLENETWKILPENKQTIKTKWVCKIKKDGNNKPDCFKARLVAKTENCIFYNKDLIIALYVDDIVISSKDKDKIQFSKDYISKELK